MMDSLLYYLISYYLKQLKHVLNEPHGFAFFLVHIVSRTYLFKRYISFFTAFKGLTLLFIRFLSEWFSMHFKLRISMSLSSSNL